MQKQICIVGGGPGGLTLARVLETRGISATVLELDEHALARPQGGSLDIHGESGQFALREAGLFSEFRALARYDDQYDAFYDQAGKLHFEIAEESTGGNRPEIDRTQLRDILIASLPKRTIRWGTKVKSIESLPDHRFRVIDQHGAALDFDLVIGADGAWSKVRPLVSPDQPIYTGVTFIELSLDEVDAKYPQIAAILPRGKISAVGSNQAFIAQRSSGSHVRAYFMFRVEEDWVKNTIDLSSPINARANLKKHLPGWSTKFLAFVDACNGDAIVPRPILSLPVGHRWEHRAGVTLIGDAAHLMTPFSGEGVNMAMLDAAELAIALSTNSNWDEAIEGYEQRMFARAAEASAGAMEGLDFVSENGLAHVLEHFRNMQKQADSA